MSTKEQRERIELLQGTLDVLILRTLLLGPTHGHAIAKAIEFRSEDVLQVEQGSLYPALHRLIKRGWISVQDGASENNRRAKFYRLTAKGRRQLEVETGKWDKLAAAHDSLSGSVGLRMRAMAPASLSHLPVSTSSWRLPLAVSR